MTTVTSNEMTVLGRHRAQDTRASGHARTHSRVNQNEYSRGVSCFARR